jgi:hypothetical protein
MVHLSLNFYPFNFATILTFIVMLLAMLNKKGSPSSCLRRVWGTELPFLYNYSFNIMLHQCKWVSRYSRAMSNHCCLSE